MSEQLKCRVTHPQIACGTCPCCGLVVASDPTSPSAGPVTSGVNWNIARLLDDLDRDDVAIRLITILNLSDHLPPLEEAVPVVRKALHDRAERVRDRALTAAVRLVTSAEDRVTVETCESLLRQDPSDLAALHFSTCFCFTDPLVKLVGWMLFRDQRKSVFEYLRREQELVPEFRERLAKWASEIERGLTPDFQDKALLPENLKVVEKLDARPAT